MTREEFCEKVKTMSSNIYIILQGREYNVANIVLYDSKTKTFKCDRIGIYDVEIAKAYDEEHRNDENYTPDDSITWYKTLDEMLDNYKIDGVPFGELTDKIEDMWCTIFAY